MHADSKKTFDSLADVAGEIKRVLGAATDRKKVVTLYAFNATGKTRLSNILSDDSDGDESEGTKVLCYNAFLEDAFIWDNESLILRFRPDFWVAQLAKDEGLEPKISKNFRDITSSKLEPNFDFEKGEVSFSVATGNDGSLTNIKISRSEERVLIWAIFSAVLEAAMDALNVAEGTSSIARFNDLRTVVIDDPVSSIDDTRIIRIALELKRLIQSSSDDLKFVITTHHALFYNVLTKSFTKSLRPKVECYCFLLEEGGFVLKKQGDTPFAYHLTIKSLIEAAVSSNGIERLHFNLFRNLLEKTANFLGYTNWEECLAPVEKKDQIKKLLDVYSHSRLSELESREITTADKALFVESFTSFVDKFRWK